MANKLGIDVSKHNGTIDWAKVKSSCIQFAIMRGGYGNVISQKDASFDYNITNALNNGIDVGVYWFSYAISANDAIKEANTCLQVIGKYKDKIKLPIFFDYEYDSVTYSQHQGVNPTNALINSIANAFCQTIQAAGYQVGIYTNLDFIRSGKFSTDTLKRYELWLADYTGTPDVACGIQQTSSQGKVNGISGNVDMDVAFKDYGVHTGSDAVSDTTVDFSLTKGSTYQFKITSSTTPNFVSGTAGVFQIVLASHTGKDYFYKVTAIGNIGQSSGMYLDNKKICVITITSATLSNLPPMLNLKKGTSFQAKVTSKTKPQLICGNGSIFRIDFITQVNNDFYFSITAIGNVGNQAGFYVDNIKVSVGNII